MYDVKSNKLSKAASVWRLMRLRAHEGHLPSARQAAEILMLWARNGIKPAYYFSAGLYRRDLSWREKKAHISERTYRRVIAEVNPSRYHFVTDNKIIVHGLLTTFGIPTPPFYGVVNPSSGWTFDGHPLRTPDDLEALLRRVKVPEACFKLVAGLRGQGFLKVGLVLDDDPPTVIIQPQGRRVPLREFWKRHLAPTRQLGYFCQGVIEQHPDVARFNPGSLNTIRTWMVQGQNGQWEMYEAILRIGIGEMITDNLSAGGIGAKIDLETGRLAGPAQRRPHRPTFSMHPNSGEPIEGRTVPMWEDAKALCRKTASLLPYLRLVAVDVAFSTSGPLVVEITACPDEFQVEFDRGIGPFLRELTRRPVVRR